MQSASKYTVVKAWQVGADAPAAGEEVTLTRRQAAYPLAMGCVEPVAHAQTQTKKKQRKEAGDE